MIKNFEQVDSRKYSSKYYEEIYHYSTYNAGKGYFISCHSAVYKQISNLCKFSPGDKIIDYGCGNGDLAFYLAAKYKYQVTGIDYSKDAIQICKKKLKKIKKGKLKVSFIHLGNVPTGKFKDTQAFIFCDVLEHICDSEIIQILKKIKSCNLRGKVKIIVHTDNVIYLKLTRHFFSLLYFLTHNKDLTEIREELKIERELHINLTSPKRSRRLMKESGFCQILFQWPNPEREQITKQLGPLSRIPFLVNICSFFLNKFPFLSPTFYAVYEINN